MYNELVIGRKMYIARLALNTISYSHISGMFTRNNEQS